MPTDDERREVARRLRELEKCVIGAFIPTGELAENILRAIDYGYSGAMTPYGRLADLIEPSCDRDALLALASSMSARRSWLSATDAERGKAIARRIREACGEEVS